MIPLLLSMSRSLRFDRIVLLTWLLLPTAVLTEAAACERLKASLTYTQEEAPRDLSGVLPVVVEKVNRVLDGVVDVEVEWTGAELHGRVGEHIVECTVTRLASAVASTELKVSLDDDGREVTSQCFHVPFTILDTNECILSANHPMKHKCQSPSVCVNTIGSYECLCPKIGQDFDGTVDDAFWKALAEEERSTWELSFRSASKTSCPSSASTHDCCPAKPFSAEGMKCRQRFRCPTDPCKKSDCAPNAECVRAKSASEIPNYTCQCPDGLMGNGHACQPKDAKPQPKVMFDGVTPTELTVKNNFYCGCTKPIVDACSGFPPCKGKHTTCTVTSQNTPTCACKPGYVLHEEYGCVDTHPPTLKLRHDPHGDQTLRLKQGDEYREYFVDIIDENAEDYLRSLKISYSRALPPGCLTQVGEFNVTYTVSMPWATTPYVRITRRVIIDDIDECSIDVSKYQHTCPALVPQCDEAAGAKCINTIGSYACQCPAQSSGDGFVETAKFVEGVKPPTSYQGGKSCVDTSKPAITLNGPNPKVFKICECGGLSGFMSQSSSTDVKELLGEQRKFYEQDIKQMIRASSGAELCASHGNPNPKPRDCVKAIDRTYQGDIDLSDRVVVGEPIKKSSLRWSVPYDVVDDAGNKATTVWRDVVVQEVDLASVETKIRQEVMKDQEEKTERAVQKALREEKIKWEREKAGRSTSSSSRSRQGRNAAKTCPACPPCDCPNSEAVGVSRESCEAYCENVARSCTLSDESYMYRSLFWLEDLVPPALIPLLGIVTVLFILFVFARFIIAVIFNPLSYQSNGYGYVGPSNDDGLLRSPGAAFQIAPPPPRESLADTNNSFFSPSGTQAGYQSPEFRQRSPATPASSAHRGEVFDESIYNTTPSIITPSRTGEGGRLRRGPYT